MVTEQRKNQILYVSKIKEKDKKFRHDTNIFYQINVLQYQKFQEENPKENEIQWTFTYFPS